MVQDTIKKVTLILQLLTEDALNEEVMKALLFILEQIERGDYGGAKNSVTAFLVRFSVDHMEWINGFKRMVLILCGSS